MKTTLKRRLAKGFSPVLLLAVCLSLSSCIWAPYGHHRHGRDRDHGDHRGYYEQVHR